MSRNRLLNTLIWLFFITLLLVSSFGLIFLTGSTLDNLSSDVFGIQQDAFLHIQVYPDGSTVLLNGKEVGKTPLDLAVKPGKYRIEIRNSDYTSFEETVLLQARQRLIIEYTLLFHPYIQNISGDAVAPTWVEDSSLMYFEFSNRLIMNLLSSGEPIEIQKLEGYVAALSYCAPNFLLAQFVPEENNAYSNTPNAISIDLSTHEVNDLGEGAFTGLTENGECRAYWIGWTGDFQTGDIALRSGNPKAQLQSVILPEKARAIPPETLSFSADKNWLMISTGTGISFWEYDGNAFDYVSSISEAFGAVWSPINSSLVFMGADASIYLIESPERSQKKISSFPGSLPLRWTPNGNQVVFTTYNPTNGGSSFWAVDANNSMLTLLADSSLILGRVTDFAISPDGSRIAYTNDLNHLNILFIGE